MGLIELIVDYHKMRTFSPPLYATHLSIQLIGHALGWKSFNPDLPPRGVIHNSFICLIGKSGKSKKSTAQDVIGELYPHWVLGPTYFSPEGLLKALSKKQRMICNMGEFSQVLRSIKYSGNMINFKEISNDLFTRRNVYSKTLVNAEYTIKKPYLSLSTTCTQEEFLGSIKSDMVHGGFIPRWLLVYSKEPERRKIQIADNINDYENYLKGVINDVYNINKPTNFQFDDEANDLLYDIQCRWEDDIEYETVQPFVARYIDYLVKYADILYFSSKLTKLTKLTKVTELTDFTKTIGQSNSINSVKPVNSVKSVNSDYLKMSLKLIEPCLKYAVDVVSFIDEENTIGKILKVMTGKKEMERSDLLRYSHLKKTDFNEALGTLFERNEFYPEIVVSGEGKSKKSKQLIKRRI